MILIFEDSGKLIAARLMSKAEASLQAETASGKRVKIKPIQVLLELNQEKLLSLDEPALLEAAAAVDLDLAWEFAPEGEFSALDLAREYFSAQPSAQEQLALLLALTGAPHYFRRAGKNKFKKASSEVLQLALAGIEKRKQITAQIDAWAASLQAGVCPEPIAAQLYPLLFSPDKNGAPYKALAQAAKAAQLSPLELLQQAGALQATPEGAYNFHWQRFLFEHFPKGTGFADLPAPAMDAQALPLAEEVQAFSIDDSSTTEIDDALSVQGLGRALVTVGIHIAAPGLALQPGDALDAVARARMSTVYMPGQKITMLPDAVVQDYTLGAGQARPALSLYLKIDSESLEILDTQTKIERVPIAANLRLEALEGLVSAETLVGDSAVLAKNLEEKGLLALQNLPEQLAFLYRLAQHWKAQREAKRGKPESFNRPDYNFKLDKAAGTTTVGDERVLISERQRGSALDTIVAECAIVVNSTWGQWLGSIGVPLIYRSQAALLPGVKVRMGIKPLPHAGLGVSAYAWSSSPLRRYVDLLNQWQIIAAVKNGATAALLAPFKPKDAQLFAIISAFDEAYSAYNTYQAQMERFWTLRHIQQNAVSELDGVVFRDGGWVRAEHLPLSLQVFGADGLPKGSRVRIKLGEIDLLSLELTATVLARLDNGQQTELDDETEEEPTGALQLAADDEVAPVAETSAPAPESAA